MQIQIQGLEQVQKRLKEAPSLLVAKSFYKALDRAIGVLAAEVEARTPEGEEGLLKESVITDVKIDDRHRGGSAAVGFSSEQSERTGRPQDLIAFWVEYGHELLSHSGKPIGHVPAHPFMRPALDAVGDQVIEVFGDTLIDSLSDIEE